MVWGGDGRDSSLKLIALWQATGWGGGVWEPFDLELAPFGAL